jgi:hypothetical protein
LAKNNVGVAIAINKEVQNMIPLCVGESIGL